MSDEDYELMMIKVKDQEQKKKLAEALKSDKEREERTYSEYEESDEEKNAAGSEFSSDSNDLLSLGHGDSENEYDDLYIGGYCNGKALNNSFSGPYSKMDHIHADRGPNPQFQDFK